MLHILWMILKIILIALGVLAGLVLLLLLLVLFVPIRYRASGSRHEEDIRGEARVSWLLSAVSATVAYRDGQRSLCIRILGIPLETLKRLFAKLRRGKRRAPGEAPRIDHSVAEKPRVEGFSQDSREKQRTDDDEIQLPPVPAGEEVHLTDTETVLPEEESPGKIASAWGRITAVRRRICRLARAVWTKLVRVVRLILGIPGRIGWFFHRISLTFTKFYDRIDRWKTFFRDERTVAGLHLGWDELKKVLGHIAPRKISGDLVIGLENPAATGQALALFGATIPLHRNRVAVQPVFDRKVLEADVRMRGRIYLFYVLIRGIKLYFDKNIKYIMKEFNKEG